MKPFKQVIHLFFEVIHIFFPQRPQLFPLVYETGERTDPTLRMIERPVAVVAPRDRPAWARLDAVPHLPPVIPELPEIGPAILGGRVAALEAKVPDRIELRKAPRAVAMRKIVS